MFFGCIEFSYVLYGLYDWGATKYQANDQSLHKQSQQSNSILTKDLSNHQSSPDLHQWSPNNHSSDTIKVP